ncbi:enhanced intracellular survival protein Eis [Cohnella sp.]|uniref:GNAT family N-acetyltransferase n=1 Tax=Cohnella sp. TaxID=1883426 RepID=UPI00356683D0
MEIRQLRADEFEERVALSEFAFQFQLPPEKLETHRTAFRPEWEWGIFNEKGEMLSVLSILPFETWIQGKKIAMGGIAGVATWPEARRQGSVSKLLVHSLDTMRKNGQTISMLHPFAFSFYRKYGWEMTIERKNYTILTHQLPPRVEMPGQVKRMPKPDINMLDQVYSKYASRYSGTLVRTADWWERKILSKTGMMAVYISEAGEPEGYVFYETVKRKLTVHDWTSITDTARQALWTYIGNHDSMIDEVSITVPVDDSLPFLLPDPRVKQELIPYFMTRIVDAEAFAGLYSWSAGESEEEVVITLTDAHAPWNNGVFRLVWSKEGTARLERMELKTMGEGQGNKIAEETTGLACGVGGITCDIQALTAMLLGNRKPIWMREAGRITGSEESIMMLERRIPIGTTHLMDFF